MAHWHGPDRSTISGTTRSNSHRRGGLWLGPARRRTHRGNPAGDVVWFPPGEKHWHGAIPNMATTHIALQEKLNGKVVDWMEQVSDE